MNAVHCVNYNLGSSSATVVYYIIHECNTKCLPKPAFFQVTYHIFLSRFRFNTTRNLTVFFVHFELEFHIGTLNNIRKTKKTLLHSSHLPQELFIQLMKVLSWTCRKCKTNQHFTVFLEYKGVFSTCRRYNVIEAKDVHERMSYT